MWWTKKISSILILLMFFAASGFSQKKHKPFRVLSYNIMEGLKKDTLKRKTFVDWASQIDADVIALQEVNHYTDADLAKLATEMNYPYSVLLKENGYPTALLSRWPIKNVKKITENLLHGYLYAEIKGYHFFVLHLNPFDYQKRNAELTTIMNHASLLDKKSSVLLMGDFNSLSSADSAEYNSRPRKLALLKNHELTRPHIKNVNNGQLDYSVLARLMSAGYVDSWKAMHPGVYQKTAPTKAITADPDHSGRIDYIWMNKRLKSSIRKVEIINDRTTAMFSDHYPIVIELQ